MIDGIVITTYYTATPPRVFWVVLKGNKVEGSGFELARASAIEAAREEALRLAEACASRAGLATPFVTEYWTGNMT